MPERSEPKLRADVARTDDERGPVRYWRDDPRFEAYEDVTAEVLAWRENANRVEADEHA